MIDRLRRRITVSEREGGFTLIELLVVIVIIGVLLAIAVPSYLGFKARAQQKAAEANVRSAIPAVEAFYSDNNTYAGIDLATLRASYDAGLPATLTFANLGAATYCVQDTQGAKVARKNGPAAQIEQLAC